MRTTKALLCAAALAAGAVTSMAQSNVYSLNVVGYINLTLTNGFNLIANQLDADGNMTNNTIQSVFSTNLPSSSRVYAFDPTTGTYQTATYSSSGGGKWIGGTNAVNAALAPGKGVFVSVAGSSPITLTLVGNVVQGTNVMGLTPGLQIVSSIPPIAGGLQANLGYVPTHNDRVYLFNAASQGYSTRTFGSGTTWIGGQPTVNVGDAFFLQSVGATNWAQAFTVQ